MSWKTNTADNEEHVVLTLARGGGSIMLKICFFSSGTGKLVKINVKIDRAT